MSCPLILYPIFKLVQGVLLSVCYCYYPQATHFGKAIIVLNKDLVLDGKGFCSQISP